MKNNAYLDPLKGLNGEEATPYTTVYDVNIGWWAVTKDCENPEIAYASLVAISSPISQTEATPTTGVSALNFALYWSPVWLKPVSSSKPSL
mgnify:CR=1 FL=1